MRQLYEAGANLFYINNNSEKNYLIDTIFSHLDWLTIKMFKGLVDWGYDVNSLEEFPDNPQEKGTALHKLIRKYFSGNLDMVSQCAMKKLIKSGSNLMTEHNGVPIFNIILDSLSWDLQAAALERIPADEFVDQVGTTPLLFCVARNKSKQIGRMLEKVSLKCKLFFPKFIFVAILSMRDRNGGDLFSFQINESFHEPIFWGKLWENLKLLYLGTQCPQSPFFGIANDIIMGIFLDVWNQCFCMSLKPERKKVRPHK
jgi:hypothetical protein